MSHHDHVFKPESAHKLVNDARMQQLPARSILELMEIKNDDIVADFGAGNGYFTLPIASHTTEMVYAIDAEPKMLELLKVRATEAEVDNIEYIVASIEDTPLKTDSIDKILMSRTLHHAYSLDKTLKEIKRVLHFDGLVYIIEYYKDEKIEGPPIEMRLSSNELTNKLHKLNFHTEVVALNDEEYGIKARLK